MFRRQFTPCLADTAFRLAFRHFTLFAALHFLLSLFDAIAITYAITLFVFIAHFLRFFDNAAFSILHTIAAEG